MQAFFDNNQGFGRLTADKTYLVDGDSITIPERTQWWGPRTAIIKNADASGDTILIEGDNVVLRGFTVDGGNSTSTLAAGYEADHIGIHIVGTTSDNTINVTIDDMTVKNCGQAGIEGLLSTDCIITNNSVSRCGYGGIIFWSPARVHIHGNSVSNIYPGETAGNLDSNCYGIVLSNFNTVGHGVPQICWVTDNYIATITWEGIDQHNGLDIKIIGNHVVNCGSGIVGEYHSGTSAHRLSIQNNTIDGYGTSMTLESLAYPSISGIGVKGAPDDSVLQGQGLQITGNIIRECGDTRSSSGSGSAILVRNFRNIVVADNSIFSPFKRGIMLDNGTTDSVLYGVVSGNSIDATQTVGAVANDIYCSTRVAVLVQGNFAQGGGDGFTQAGGPTFVSLIQNNYLFS
jgi:hypothetical protein